MPTKLVSVAPLEFSAVIVSLNDLPAVSAVGERAPLRKCGGRGRTAAHQRADDKIRDRRAQPGDIVVARPGRVFRLPALVPLVIS